MAAKIIYIAHAIGAVDPVDYLDAQMQQKHNIESLLRVIEIINTRTTSIIPFVPYLADVMALNDNNQDHRLRGLGNALGVLDRMAPVLDAMWLTGPRLSEGMKKEIAQLQGRGVSVVDLIGKDIAKWLKNFNY